MDRKAYHLTLILLVVTLVGCGQASLRKSSESTHGSSMEVKTEESPSYGEGNQESFSDREFETVSHWAVWVRGVAVDSFSGLGFLQQMETLGLKLEKVAGTGMGCWVAMSWALKNKSNYAEWQAMKFDSWDGLSPGLLGRFQEQARREAFLNYFQKLKHSQKEGIYQIPVECPLYENQSRALNLARDLRLEDRLFKQFDLDLLEFGSFSEFKEYRSGAMDRSYGEDFLESLSEDIRAIPEKTVWLILETSANHRLWGSEQGIVKGVTRTGVRWIRLPIGRDLTISAQQLKDFKLRRKWLLQGRRDAKAFLNTPDVKEFLGL